MPLRTKPLPQIDDRSLDGDLQTPERRLAAAVISRALADLVSFSDKPEIVEEVLGWITTIDPVETKGLYSFERLCGELCIPPDKLRALARKISGGQTKGLRFNYALRVKPMPKK